MSSRSTLFSATCVHCSSVRGPKSAHSWRMWRGLRHRASDRAGLHALRDNDLMCPRPRQSGRCSLQSLRAWSLNTAVGIGEIALGAIRRPAVRGALRPAGPLHHARGGARSLVAIGRQRLCFCLQGHLGGADAFEAGGLVLLATQSGISSPRSSAPCSRSSAASVASARTNQADTSAASFFSASRMRIGHRLVHTGIGLNLSAAERHMSELHAIERRSRLT